MMSRNDQLPEHRFFSWGLLASLTAIVAMLLVAGLLFLDLHR